jgi:RNA polymerase sigma-70 factor (ECF subfamily)
MNLIQRYRAGEEGAFADLFHQYKNLVYRTAYLLLGDAQAAEDALQEVFVKVYRSLNTFDPEKGAFTTWLRRITVNHCLNVRRKRPASSLETLASKLSPSAATPQSLLPEELVISQEQVETVWQAVQQLSLPLRVVVVLRYYQELPYQEIAQVLNIPLGTVKWRLHEALKTLRDELQGEALRKELAEQTRVRLPSRSRRKQEEDIL